MDSKISPSQWSPVDDLKRTNSILKVVKEIGEITVPSLFHYFNCDFIFGMPIESCVFGADKAYQKRHETNKGGIFSIMLETIIVILLVLWLVGLVAGQTFGGILHVLLLVAVVVFVIRLLTGRAAV
ncbi:MAG: lmo0937 family membrane protein [Pyrinomonadaceae bacterium]